MGMSFCKCSNVFEPFKLRANKDKMPPSICHENNLTKEGKISPNQSFKLFDKASIYKIEEKNGYFESKKATLNNINNFAIHGNKKLKEMQENHNKKFSERSLDEQNTPRILIHEIKKFEGNVEIPIVLENSLFKKFNRDSFMEMFKNPHNKDLAKLEDIAP